VGWQPTLPTQPTCQTKAIPEICPSGEEPLEANPGDNRDCLKIGSGALSVVVLSKEDAVTQKGKVGSSVHLSLEQVGFGVHAFGASIVVGEGDRSSDGVGGLVDASGEGVDVG
jgi:hypothetical protein